MDGDIKSNVMPIQPTMAAGHNAPLQSNGVKRSDSPLSPGGNGLPENADDKTPISDDKVAKAVSNLNDYVQVIRRELQFRVDEATGRTVVTVLDAETHEVIRQIPREEVLALARHLGSTEKGLLFSTDT